MSRPLFALAFSAAFLMGCATPQASHDMTPILTDTEDMKAAINDEVNRLLVGEDANQAAQGSFTTSTETAKKGDTALSLLRNAGGPESIFYDLPTEDRQQLADLSPGDKLVFLKGKRDQIAGIAINQDGIWHTAKKRAEGYRLTPGLALDPPKLVVHDLPLMGTLSSTLNESQLPPESQNAIKGLLAQGFSDDSFSKPGWLRLRVEHAIVDGMDIGPPSLVSAALSTDDTPAFMVRYQTREGNLGYYNGDGERLEPDWIAHPVRGEYRITSEYDPYRQHPVTGRVRPHNGRDFAARSGTTVVAASGGTVEHAGWKGSWGRLIILRHPNGLETRYAHLRSTKGLAAGHKVKRGEAIGQVGTSGLSTGPHLHFEVYHRGIPQDPATFTPDKRRALADSQLKDSDHSWFAKYRTLEAAALPQKTPTQPTSWVANGNDLTGQGGPESDE